MGKYNEKKTGMGIMNGVINFQHFNTSIFSILNKNLFKLGKFQSIYGKYLFSKTVVLKYKNHLNHAQNSRRHFNSKMRH